MKDNTEMEVILQTFNEEMPLLEGEAVHRSSRWVKRKDDSEPWWITFIIYNKGEMFPLIINDSQPRSDRRHDDDEEEGWENDEK